MSDEELKVTVSLGDAELKEEISKLKDENGRLRRALAPLYEHSKNNLQICGLTERARQALKE